MLAPEFIIIVVVLLCIIFGMNLKIIREHEAMIIERFGRLNRVLYQGVHFLIPFLDAPRNYNMTIKQVGLDGKVYNKLVSTPIVSLKEMLWDSSGENAITDDGETISFNILLYYQIVNPVKAVYMVENLFDAVGNVTLATLKKYVSGYKAEEVYNSADFIQNILKDTIQLKTEDWGIDIKKVELSNLVPNSSEENFYVSNQ